MTIDLDKQAHALAGCALAGLAYIGCGSLLAALLMVAVAGWYKEYVFDARRTESHTVDPMDMLATWAGAAPVVLVVLVRELLT